MQQEVRITVDNDVFQAKYTDKIVETITNRYPGAIVEGLYDRNPIREDQRICDVSPEILENCDGLIFQSMDQWKLNKDEILIRYSFKSQEKEYITVQKRVQNSYSFKSFFNEEGIADFNIARFIFNQNKLNDQILKFSQLLKEGLKRIELFITEKPLNENEILVTVYDEKEEIIYMEPHLRNDQIQSIPISNDYYFVNEQGCHNVQDKFHQILDQCTFLAINKTHQVEDTNNISVVVIEGGKFIGRQTVQKSAIIIQSMSKKFQKPNHFVIINGQFIQEEKKEKFQDYLKDGQKEIVILIIQKYQCYAEAYAKFKQLADFALIQKLKYKEEQQIKSEVFGNTVEPKIFFEFFKTEILYMMQQNQETLKNKKTIRMMTAQTNYIVYPNYELLCQQQQKVYPSLGKKIQTQTTQKSLICNGQSSAIVMCPSCYQCQQPIFENSIQLYCCHSYHEDCLKEIIKTQLNQFQSGKSIGLKCICNQKIGGQVLRLFDNQLWDKFQNLMLVVLLSNCDGIMKCKGEQCQFFFIKQKNKYNQINLYCEFCQRHYA